MYQCKQFEDKRRVERTILKNLLEYQIANEKK